MDYEGFSHFDKQLKVLLKQSQSTMANSFRMRVNLGYSTLS